MSSMKTFFACVVIAGAVTLIASGCSRHSEKTPTSPLNAAAPTATAAIEPEIKKVERTNDSATGDHGHKPGAHGGIMISLGRDSFHAEAVFVCCKGCEKKAKLNPDKTLAKVEQLKAKTKTLLPVG